jgi:hypothetical protein
MSTIIGASIDLAKLKNAPVIKGKNGAEYVNITIIVNDEPNQWGKDVSISLEQSKEEREAKVNKTFVGNGKTIYNSNKF